MLSAALSGSGELGKRGSIGGSQRAMADLSALLGLGVLRDINPRGI